MILIGSILLLFVIYFVVVIHQGFFSLDAQESKLDREIYRANKEKDRPAQQERIKEKQRELNELLK